MGAMRVVTIGMTAMGLATGACGKKPDAPAKVARGGDAGATSDAAIADAGIDAAAGFAPRSATADELAAAQAFVDRWLATQNGGDFAAYEALYDPRFHGVRRTGQATRRFDRAGWMADRKAMFRKPMAVTATHLVVYVAGPDRQVFFTQTWSQGRFRDVGTKNLVLTGAGDQTRIQYEELLGSRIVAPTPPAAVATDGDTWFGYDRAASLAAMRLAPVDGTSITLAGTRRALAPIELEVIEAVRDAAAGGVGAVDVTGDLAQGDPLRALDGATVVVLGADLAARCRGTIAVTGAEVVTYLDDVADDEPAAAVAAWRAGPYLINAELTAPCTGPFVRGVDAPELVAIADANGLGLPAVKAFARDLADAGADATVADAIDDGARGFALVNVERADGCAAPELHERVLATATKDAGRWTLGEVARIEGTDGGLTVVDLDGDGALDAVLAGGVYLAGRFDLWTPNLFIAWPAGLGCDGYDGD
ncbi:MAG: nuclear transport factor 2 family protein [Myxococcales bacterium]|nr:nuclear transport factor 2 family protein [Myxococcales bacterium]